MHLEEKKTFKSILMILTVLCLTALNQHADGFSKATGAQVNWTFLKRDSHIRSGLQ